MKKTLFPIIFLAILLAVLMMIPMVIMPTAAQTTVTQYADNDLEGLTVGASIKSDKTNFFATTPSLATVANDNGNKVIKLPLRPENEAGSVRDEYFSYGGTVYTVTDSSVVIDGETYPVVDGKVTINGIEYTTSTDACAYELCYGGPNIDKNIMVTNKEMSYVTEDKIYLQAEYYISEDAKGTVQTQFMNFSYEGSDGSRVKSTWYSMYYLSLDSAGLKTDLHSVVTGVFDRGEWNTVTTVIDLDTGDRDFYVNNRYIFSDATTKYKKLILNANNWIVAKINKTSADPASLSGYLLIDDLKAATYTDADLYEAPVVDENGDHLVELDIITSTGRLIRRPYEGIRIPTFCGAGASVTPLYFDFSAYEGIVAPVAGASVRLTHAAGIRYATQLDLDLLDGLLALKENGMVRDVGIGTLVSPKSYVRSAGAFTVDALKALEGTNAKFVDVKGTVGAYYHKLPAAALEDGYDTYFVGSLSNIKLGNRAVDFSAIGYVRVTLNSGIEVYFYSYDYNADTIGNYSRNVKGLAEAALNDQNTSYTEVQRLILSGLFNGATVLNVSSSSVQDVQYTTTELFFRNAAGVYCRLTYEGKNGWRLQANGSGYNGFDETGAGQALSLYLGEIVENKTEPLKITKGDGKIIICVDSTDSRVELSTGASFALSFYTAAGVRTSNVTAIEVADTVTTSATQTVTLKGALASGEAVYGGGERFDVVNQRGRAFQLFTEDGWNNATASYMVIPLFVTSRGAGMFVNRYENMAVDFGKTVTDEWKITINNNLIDCYFYATGRMSDALLGYTEISGHSSLPEEWGQGELICRYGPDLSTFEDLEDYIRQYASYKMIPEYKRYGVYATKYYSSYTAIPNYTSYYVKSKTDSTSFAQISTNPGTSAYDYTILYADAQGSSIAYGKVSARYYPLGKNWASLAEADAFGTSSYDMSTLYRLKYDENDSNLVIGINSSRNASYVLLEDGTYRKMGAKGNPAGYGVKTIVENLINAGMKPTAMILEPWSWHAVNSSMTAKEDLKHTVDWLEERGIKTMLYMGVGGIGTQMQGYREDYHVWATLTHTDGTVERTYRLPRTSGANVNPDVTSSVQSFIDITNPVAVDWYMNEIWGTLIDIGVDGIKIDFCETMPDEGDYTGFSLKYDWYDDTIFEGDNVHHAYAVHFISLFYKSMMEQKAAKNIPDGFIVLSRGGGIGSQRNPYLWEGDQTRTFEKIEDQLIALINSGISGVPFMTYDMAGYQYSGGTQFTGIITLEKESEIFARAIEYTAFTSNIQTHGDVRQAYEMTEETQEIYRRFTDIHEKLIPYIQKYSKIACDTGMPVVRAMVLEYQNDANVYNLETQYMLGKALLVAPVTTEGTTQKSVYLPEGTWLDLLTGETLEGGQTIVVDAPLGQLPVFMNTECSVEDNNLLVDVFNSETWQRINGGVELNLEKLIVRGDPWLEDVFED